MWFSRFPQPSARLAAVAGDLNAPQKHVWRARIVLMTADGLGTMAIARRTGSSPTDARLSSLHRPDDFMI
jgi:hypothetical protein